MKVSKDSCRITIRVPLNVLETLKEAAKLTGMTVNQFVIQAALEKAQAIIDRERTIKLTSEDAALLINMLDQPSNPNEALTLAFKRYESKGNNVPSNSSVT